MEKNMTKGRAVADIKKVFFRKFDGGAEPVINQALFTESEAGDKEKWFSTITLRGTVNVNQDDVSVEKINIDQSNMPIGITTEPGDFNFEATLPSLASKDLEQWLHKGASLEVTDGDGDTYKGFGYDIDGEIIECSAFIVTRTKDAFVFPRCMVSVAFNKEDKVFGLKLSGQVLGASNEDNKDVYVLADHEAGESVVIPNE